MNFPYDVNDMCPNRQTLLIDRQSVENFADYSTVVGYDAEGNVDQDKHAAWEALPDAERFEQQATFFTAAALSAGWNRVERFGNEFVLWANVVHVK